MEDLQEMREQLAILKQKLDNESIVNEHLMREVTRQKVRRLNRNVWQEGLSCLFVITFGSYAFCQLGLSYWFIGATVVLMLVCFLATFIPHRRIKMNEIMSGDLLSVAKQIRKLKHFYQEWLKYGIPAVIVWVGWFAFEVFQSYDNWKLALSIIIGCIVGACAGGLIGYKHHRQLVGEMDELIHDIERE